MPVSKTSALGVRSTNSGGSRWIGRRSVDVDRAAIVDRLAQQIEDPAQRFLADRHGQRTTPVSTQSMPRRRPSVLPSATARTRAAAQVLLHFADQVDRHAVIGAVDR